jgi:hypothetical protein
LQNHSNNSFVMNYHRNIKEKNKKTCLVFAKRHTGDTPTYGRRYSGQMRQKCSFFNHQGKCYVWRKPNTSHHPGEDYPHSEAWRWHVFHRIPNITMCTALYDLIRGLRPTTPSSDLETHMVRFAPCCPGTWMVARWPMKFQPLLLVLVRLKPASSKKRNL